MFYARKSLCEGNGFRVPSFFKHYHRGVEIEEVLYCQWLQNIGFLNEFGICIFHYLLQVEIHLVTFRMNIFVSNINLQPNNMKENTNCNCNQIQ